MFFAIKNIKSPPITLNHGVPQGSSITPILFILYVSDLPSPTHEYKVHRSQFADDICEFTSAKQTRFIQQQLQNSINQITTYSGVYRIGLHAGKTAQIFFHHHHHHHHHRIIQKHEHLGRYPIHIHQKHPGPSPHIQSKCRQIWELTIHQTLPSTPF